MNAPLPLDEEKRLQVLDEYQILDSDAEQIFDDLAFMASQLCDTPFAGISLVDEKHQWFKAKVGLAESETPRDIAFCAHTILQRDLFTVEDAQKDARFASNPLVTGTPHIRFYAGCPLIVAGGQALGSICVIDQVPRILTAEQKLGLEALGRQVISQLESRHNLKAHLAGKEQLLASELSYRRLFEAAQDGILILDVETGRITDVNPFLVELLGFSRIDMIGRTVGELSPFKDIESNQTMLERLQRHGYARYEDLPMETRDGRLIAVEFVCNVYLAGHRNVIQCNVRDITQRKKSEQRLSLLNTCVSHLSDIVIITEAEPLDEPGPKIVFVNPAFERVTGYTAAEALGRSPRFLQGGATDRESLGVIRRALSQGKPVRQQLINYKKDGSPYWMDIDVVPVLDAKGKRTHFAAIQRDVTEEKKIESQLLWKTAFFEAQVNSSLDAIIVVDSQGKLVLQNEKMVEMWKAPPEVIDETDHRQRLEWVSDQVVNPRQFSEKVAYLYAHPDEISRDELELINGKFLDRYTAPVVGRDGKYFGRIWTYRDVTERKRVDAHVVEQAALLDKTQDAILVRDLEGNITFWNRGAERMYGWMSQEIIGRNLGELFYTNQKKFAAHNDLLLSQGEWHGEIQHLNRQGDEITVEARWTLIRDSGGNPKSVLAINTDITEKKKIEAQFMRAQRMESIGTLAGGIAHDLNNILSPIMLSIDVLKLTALDAQAMSILQTIELSARRGADVVRQVLSFARGLEGERTEVKPKNLLKDLENIIKDTFPRDIRLNFSVPAETWTILGDPTQVHQILLNLCVNARDAMPHGGSLSIKVENALLDEHYSAMNLQAKPGPYVNITVTDSGTGMPRGIVDKIFEPFFTTKEINRGTGLGLSTVMAIVKSHEGFVNVYSEPGKGTVFNVYLPALALSIAPQADEDETASFPRGQGETILVVDDEASILIVTGETLRAFGYRVVTAGDGAEAVAVYAQKKNEIALVLTDMMMPLMDGPALIRALKKIDPLVKIVAVSGLTANAEIGKFSGAGSHHFLTKPYTAETLLKALRGVLDSA